MNPMDVIHIITWWTSLVAWICRHCNLTVAYYASILLTAYVIYVTFLRPIRFIAGVVVALTRAVLYISYYTVYYVLYSSVMWCLRPKRKVY